MMLPLYRRIIGPSFDDLPVRVRDLRDVRGKAVWRGRADVERGTALFVRLVATLAALPHSAREVPLTVTFTHDDAGEGWHRDFGGHIFQTHQRAGDGVILERIGPATVALKPLAERDSLSLSVTALRVFGIPVPGFLLPRVRTREWEAEDCYRFEVEARLPVGGLLIRYSGWLAPTATASHPAGPISATRP